jgi:hypothetical protein
VEELRYEQERLRWQLTHTSTGLPVMNPVQPSVTGGSCAAAICVDPDNDRYVTSKHSSIYPTKDDVSPILCHMTVILFNLFYMESSGTTIKLADYEFFFFCY